MRSFLAVMTALLMCCVFNLHSQAAIETHSFANDVERQRYQSFIEEMRCPKCQNQNLAGSDSPISMDLRRELYEMIRDGRSDGEIVNFMVTRYGDFILYRPRVTPATYFLWGAPVVLLILGIVVVLLIVRKRRRGALERATSHLTDDEQVGLAALLSRAESNSESTAPNKNQQESK